MKLKYIFTYIIITLISNKILAQENNNIIQKISKKVFSTKTDTSRSNSFIALPAFAYSQETGAEYGIASTYNFYIDRNNKESKTSNISLIGTLTTKKQKKINLNADIWTKNNDYHILAEIRLRDWPFNFYGIGNNTWKANEENLEQKLYRLKLDVEKKISQKIYIGVNANYDNYKISTNSSTGIVNDNNLIGKHGGQFLAIGASTLYDSRDVTTYSTKGLYTRIKYSYSPNFFGKDNFIGSQTEIDVRGFHSLNKEFTLAAQILYRTTHSPNDNIPFYVKKDLGGDMTMRGYYLGRYKDNNYITGQAELRYRFHPRLGVVGFGGAGSTYSNKQSTRFVPTYGIGGRYFFSLEHKTSIRVDYAFGEKRPGEKQQRGFYLSLSEAF